MDTLLMHHPSVRAVANAAPSFGLRRPKQTEKTMRLWPSFEGNLTLFPPGAEGCFGTRTEEEEEE
eukprot:2666606-Rhodomonas_salina.1